MTLAPALDLEQLRVLVVDDEAGRFVLDCDQVHHTSPPGVLTIQATCSLHLEADCFYLISDGFATRDGTSRMRSWRRPGSGCGRSS